MPEITPAGWIGGSTLLLLACLLPPFILLVPLVFLLALVAPFGVRALRRRR